MTIGGFINLPFPISRFRQLRGGRLRTVELFSIAEDPYETTNEAAEQSQKVRDLRARLEAHAKEAAPPKGQQSRPADYQPPEVWGDAQ